MFALLFLVVGVPAFGHANDILIESACKNEIELICKHKTKKKIHECLENQIDEVTSGCKSALREDTQNNKVDSGITWTDQQSYKKLTSAEYQNLYSELAPQGLRPIAIRGYVDGLEVRYDVTVAKGGASSWQARHGVRDAEFQEENQNWLEKGYSLAVHSAFSVSGELLHAAVWELRDTVVFHKSSSLPETGLTSPEFAPIDTLMRDKIRSSDIPGAAVAVARNGRLLYARGFGYADLQKKDPVQPDSLFRIASVSKPFTAAAIFHLVEKGKLRLNDRVLDSLNQIRPITGVTDARIRDITILQLLHHTAGFDRDRSGDPMFRGMKIVSAPGWIPPSSAVEEVRYGLRRRLDFDPGTRYAYSNFGYCLLGRIIETAGGMKYEKYVRDNLLLPIGITKMRIGGTLISQRADKEVRYYTRNNERETAVVGPRKGHKVPIQYGGWKLESMDSQGGWIASAVDLVRFAAALDDTAARRILSKESVHEMIQPPASPVSRNLLGDLEETYYGCGWMVRRISTEKYNAWHTGRLAGTSAILIRQNDGMVWAVLFNTDKGRNGLEPALDIEKPLYQAISAVQHWPSRDLFQALQ